jgi:phosphoglycerate kinase
MAVRSVSDLEVSGKRVLLRVDFNVPIDDDGQVSDETRIVAALPTLKELVSRGAKVIAMSHLGRPKGKRVPSMSLAPVAPRLEHHLGCKVAFAEDCVGEAAHALVSELGDGEVALLENLRYHAEEEGNSPELAAKLAELGDVYVNDAFGAAHRAHASTDALPRLMKEKAAGFLMQKELDYLGGALENPSRPFVAVLGGAKISGKIDVIVNLLPRVDHLLIGGGMMYTFFKARGTPVGRSIVDEERISMAAELMQTAEREGKPLGLPSDCVISDSVKEGGTIEAVAVDAIPDDRYGVDIGPKTVETFSNVIRDSRTVVWNGPMGIFEVDAYAAGTSALAQATADATAAGAVTVVGGGDTAAAVAKAGLKDRVSHVSTGGGASLEFLSGKTLPGVAALEGE